MLYKIQLELNSDNNTVNFNNERKEYFILIFLLYIFTYFPIMSLPIGFHNIIYLDLISNMGSRKMIIGIFGLFYI